MFKFLKGAILFAPFFLLLPVISIIILLPSISSSLTFKDGGVYGTYKVLGWATTEPHGLDAGKKWSQKTDSEFTRFGGTSHRFEFRAKDCKEFDCTRGDFNGSFGRTEAYLSDSSSNASGEFGENWYAWSFYIDDTNWSYTNNDPEVINNHLIQFGQMKQNRQNDAYPQCRELGDEVVWILGYKSKRDGLGISRKYCKEDGVYENNPKDDTLIPKEILFNRWHDVVLHAEWGENGFFHLFINGDLKFSEKGFITNEFQYKGKRRGPTFRYGIYQNNAPEEFNGKIVAWYDGIARAKTCKEKHFSDLLKKLGYSCESLGDLDGKVLIPTVTKYIETSDNTDSLVDEIEDQYDEIEDQYKATWTIEKIGDLDSKRVIAEDIIIVKSDLGEVEISNGEFDLAPAVRENFKYFFEERTFNIQGEFKLDNYQTKNLNLQLLNRSEGLYKGETRINSNDDVPHKIKVIFDLK